MSRWQSYKRLAKSDPFGRQSFPERCERRALQPCDFVEASKIREYLLAFDHTIGRAKARVFRALGFDPDAWASLQEALQRHAVGGEAEEQSRSPDGRKLLVPGTFEVPSGAPAPLVSVSIVVQEVDRPRPVKAYPGGNARA